MTAAPATVDVQKIRQRIDALLDEYGDADLVWSVRDYPAFRLECLAARKGGA
jgi:hypothetical protein